MRGAVQCQYGPWATVRGGSAMPGACCHNWATWVSRSGHTFCETHRDAEFGPHIRGAQDLKTEDPKLSGAILPPTPRDQQ